MLDDCRCYSESELEINTRFNIKNVKVVKTDTAIFEAHVREKV